MYALRVVKDLQNEHLKFMKNYVQIKENLIETFYQDFINSGQILCESKT